MQDFFRYNTLNFFSLILISLLFFHASYYFKRGDKVLWKKVLFFMLLGQLLDILASLVATSATDVFIALSYAAHTAIFITSTILTAQVGLFLYQTIEGNAKVLQKYNNIFLAIIVTNALLSILSTPFGFVFSIDANNTFVRSRLYFLVIAIIMLPLIIMLAKLVYTYIKNYNRIFSDNKKIIWLVLFNIIFISLLIYLQDHIITNITIVQPSLSLSILILHLMVVSKGITIDYLTKLQNKLGLELFLTQLPRVTEEYIIAIFFDLDNFKQINDTYGHKEGDKILIKFAEILSSEVKNKNLVARIGGDEFLVVLRTQNLQEADYISSVIGHEIHNYNSTIKNYKIEYSYGMSVNYPYDPLDKNALIEKADEKMYENKFSKKQAV